MPTLRDKVADLNRRILQGDLLGAFEDYYHEDVVMTDAGEAPRVGKEVNRAYEQRFVRGLTAFRRAEVKAVGIDEEAGKALVEWHVDYTHRDRGDQAFDQVAVQTWRDGLIVDEKFYRMSL